MSTPIPIPMNAHLSSPLPTVLPTVSTTATSITRTADQPVSSASSASIEIWIESTRAAQLTSTTNSRKRKREASPAALNQPQSYNNVVMDSLGCSSGAGKDTTPADALAFQVHSALCVNAFSSPSNRYVASSHALRYRPRKQSSLHTENR